MKYTKFAIKNFRGIEEIEVDLRRNPKSNVFTLVGLNESGKTTILDAIAFFYEKVNPGSQSELHTTQIKDIHDLIPKEKRDSFSGEIRIDAYIEIENGDYDELDSLLKKSGYTINGNLKLEVIYSISWRFENSELKHELNSVGNFDFGVSKTTTRKRTINQTNERKNAELWKLTTDWLKSKLPPIIYYPNFLFDFPDRIYLEPFEGELKSQKYYRHFLEDVLKSINPDFTLENYLLNRIRSNKSQDKETLNQAVSRISKKITDLITAKNLTVLDIYTKGKEMSLAFPELDSENGAHFLAFRLKDGSNYYWIRERSLGYKWFLTFLLLTQFRVARHARQVPIFIFDEPASNLHQTAQQRLVEALKQLIEDSRAQVIYATHSHHLINPDWLENTFIVKNLALDYENDVEFDATKTLITLTRYREFVAKHPDQRNYYQIILDVLEYKPSNLENIPNIVMTEGKNDSYSLSYAQFCLYSKKILNIAPGGGSGSLDSLIRLYYAWGRNFIILLDDDFEGNKQKVRYVDVFGKIIENKLFTLKDVSMSWVGHKMEDLFQEGDRVSIQTHVDSSLITYDKKDFNRSIQELLAKEIKIPLSSNTAQNFSALIAFCDKKLQEM